MLFQRITNYLLRNRWQTVAITLIITFMHVLGVVGVLIASLGILIAALITLVKGIVEGFVVTLAATLPYIISFCISGDYKTAAPLLFIWGGISVVVLSNLLTWVFAAMLSRQTSWSTLLQVAALLGVLTVSVLHLAYPGIADWWGNQLTELQVYAAKVAGANNLLKSTADASSDLQLETINTSKQYATGVMVSLVLFCAFLQLIIARWWQASVLKNVLLRLELRTIRLSPLAGILFVVSLALCYWGNGVVLDIMPILSLLFCAAGLSLVHYLFGLIKSPSAAWFWITAFYLALIVAVPTSVLLIAVFAFFDIWLDVRAKIKKV